MYVQWGSQCPRCYKTCEEKLTSMLSWDRICLVCARKEHDNPAMREAHNLNEANRGAGKKAILG